MEVGYFAAEAGLDDPSIYALLLDADDRWQKYAQRKDRERRLTDIVERARRKHPYGTDNLEFNGILGSPVDASPKIAFNWREFIDAEVKVEWQIEGILPRLGHLLLTGDPGVGKTQIGTRAVHSLIFGRDWLNWKNLVEPQKVLMLSLEMNHPTLKYFYEIMDQDLNPDEKLALQERFTIIPVEDELDFTRPETTQFLDMLMKEYTPDCVFIDSIGKLTGGSLAEEPVAKALDKYLRNFRRQYGVSTIAIHHDNKASAANKNQSSTFGSVYITAYADTVIGFSRLEPKNKQSPIVVDCRKARLSIPFDQFLVERDKFLNFHVREAVDFSKNEKREGGFRDSVLEHFAGNGSTSVPRGSFSLFEG